VTDFKGAMEKKLTKLKELREILERYSAEVAKWEPWQRSLDPIGDEGREKYGKGEHNGKETH